jgi:hypothetical protein
VLVVASLVVPIATHGKVTVNSVRNVFSKVVRLVLIFVFTEHVEHQILPCIVLI